MGRLTSRKEAGTTVEFHYDTEEQLIGIRNEHGLVYRFELDATGEVWKESGFDNRTRIYTRDAAGRVISVQKPSGQTSNFSYDSQGRVTQVQHSDGTTEHYAYRADGELVQAANPYITVTLERDALGRRISKTFRNKTTRWVWDGNLPLHEWIVDAADFDPTNPDPLPTLPIGEEPPLLDTLLAGHPPTGPPLSPTAWYKPKNASSPKNVITWLFKAVTFPANLALPKVTVGNKLFGGQ